MPDISNQLIKDSYNYILQADLSTGVVYRIGGDIPVNPIFSSGLTINENFNFSNGTEQSGYILMSDSFGNATWVENPSGPSGNYLPLSGGTVTGPTIFTSGLTSYTISATTYFNLPKDIFVTGGTYNNGSATFTNNTGGTFTVTGFSTSTGTSFTGGTVSGATNFTDGLSANTISATTYNNLPKDIFVTGGTYNNGNAIFTNNSGGTFSVTGFPIGGGGGEVFYLNLSESQNGNRSLNPVPSTSPQQSTGVTINNGATEIISSFESPQLNVILIPGGVWSFHLHSYKENLNSSFEIFVEVYKKTSGGTQTYLFQTEPVLVQTDSPLISMQISEAYFSGTSIVVSDSVVAVVKAINIGNQSNTITFFTEGSQDYSYVISSLPTQQGLTCDTLSGCSIIQTIQTDVSNKLDKSGGTITGDLIINSGLTATTISATTYYNLPPSSAKSINSVSINTNAGSNQSTDYFYFASNSITITLPTAISNTNSYVIKNVGTGTITINTTSSQTIDGSLTALIKVQYLSLTLISDGANWNII
jgi:hypothetical protein